MRRYLPVHLVENDRQLFGNVTGFDLKKFAFLGSRVLLLARGARWRDSDGTANGERLLCLMISFGGKVLIEQLPHQIFNPFLDEFGHLGVWSSRNGL